MSTVINLFRERAQRALMHDADEAIEALSLIFGNRQRQLVALDPGTVPPCEISATFAPGDDAGIAAWLAGEAADRNVYFAHAERRAGAVQRRKVDLAAVHWLHADLDPAKGADVDTERARIEALLASPPEGVPVASLILDSGRGFQALWRLEEPLTDIPDVEARNRWLRDQLGGDPAAFDATRILRLPGTVNHKPEAQGRRARLLQHEPDAIYAAGCFGAAARAERAPVDLTPAIDELDRDDAIAAGIGICRTAPPAIEGDGGRTTAFKVGMRLKRAGLSLELSQDLALQFYNPRCSPPDADWMRERIERGYLDGEGRPGCDHPAVQAATDLPGIDPFASPLPDSARTSISALPVMDLAALGLARAPERLWAVDGMMPWLKATLLTGRGGVGKSLLAQLMSTCTALGVPFLGMTTRQAASAYISWEDDAEELWRRQEAICAAMGVPMATLAGKLRLLSMTEQTDTLLVSFDTAGNRTVTPRGSQIERYAIEHEIAFLAFDNASHLMGGDHNDLKHVAGFAHWLNALAQRINGATLLLHHPNKSGDDWLGSVAYENQFRSRLFMDRPTDAIDLNARVLSNPKANYAASGGEVRFRWWRGTFLRDSDLPADAIAEIVESTEAQHDNAVFLACLTERNRQLRPVSERPSRTYAPAVFADMPESKGVGRKRLHAAMDRLFKSGAVHRSVIGWDTVKRRPLEGVREVVGDAPSAHNARPERAPNPPTTPPLTRTGPSPEPPPHHTPYTTYMEGAAHMPAALPHSGKAPPPPASLF